MPRHPKNGAFSIAELLLAMALMAILMASVAAASQAAMTCYDQDMKIAEVTPSARWALQRMMGDVRQAEALNVTTTQLTIVPPAGTGVDEVQYFYNGGVLYYRRTIGGNTTTQALVGDGDVTLNVFSLQKQTGLDWEGVSCVKSVTVRIELRADGRPFTMTASAAPRRNLLY